MGDKAYLIFGGAALAAIVWMMLRLGLPPKDKRDRRTTSNRLMRWRVILQALAIAVALLILFLRK